MKKRKKEKAKNDSNIKVSSFSRFRWTKKYTVASIVAIVILTVTFVVYGVVHLYSANRNKPAGEQQTEVETVEEPIVLNAEDLEPDKWVESEKQRITGTDEAALQDRIAAANYYSNVYQFEKVLEELELIKNEFPNAEEDLNFLVSTFIAHQWLDNTEEMKVYATKIKNRENQTGMQAKDIPSQLRKSIDENAQ